MSQPLASLRFEVELRALRTIRWLVRRVSHERALALGRLLGGLAYAFGLRKKVVLDNLEIATPRLENKEAAQVASHLPGQKQKRLSQVARHAYQHLGMTCIEFLRLDSRTSGRNDARVEWQGLEHLDRALAAGRGVIVGSAHFGNWEIMGAAAVATGYDVTFIVQSLNNPRVDDFVCDTRRRAGLHVLKRGMRLRRLQEELDANRLVCVMCDQDARRHGLFLPFLGRAASTHKGPVQLSLRYQVPFVPVFGRRLDDGRHRITFHAEILAKDRSSENAAILSVMAQFNGLLEQHIVAAPEQYLWHHRRWKTRIPTTQPVVRAESLL